MRILHYSPTPPDSMITAYVSALCGGMGPEAVNDTASRPAEAVGLLASRRYDIAHLHGCWHNSMAKVARQALRTGARLVYSPHGELEPWVREANFWREKLPKQLLYQKRIVSRSYAVIIQGKMEEECMRKLGWNSRTFIIRNSLITQSITAAEMARQTLTVYRLVLDSNPLERMTAPTRDSLRQLIKAGITGDERWVREQCLTIDDDEQWRMLLCYAHQEHLTELVRRGADILSMQCPDLDASRIDYILPDGYKAPQSIAGAIGSSFATENDRLLATFRHLRRLVITRQIAISHLAELDRELRSHDCEEDRLNETLKERRLYTLAARLMHIMSDLTGLDEGYMPMPPLDGRATRIINRQIANHLHI